MAVYWDDRALSNTMAAYWDDRALSKWAVQNHHEIKNIYDNIQNDDLHHPHILSLQSQESIITWHRFQHNKKTPEL